jgi:hypothetical protein
MNEDRREDDVTELRELLVHPVPVPLGMLVRLEVGAVRAARNRAASISWEARLVIACLVFIALGFTSMDSLAPPVAAVLIAIALLYPWAAGPDLRAIASPGVPPRA